MWSLGLVLCPALLVASTLRQEQLLLMVENILREEVTDTHMCTCAQHTAHCTLHSVHCTLHTVHCTLHTIQVRQVDIPGPAGPGEVQRFLSPAQV